MGIGKVISKGLGAEILGGLGWGVLQWDDKAGEGEGGCVLC